MQIFKQTLAIAAAAILLAGCTKADTKPDRINGPDRADRGNATFMIRSIKGTGDLVTAQDIFKDEKDGAKRASNWRIPREANFRFSACIQDAATKADAIGHQFRVELPGKQLNISDVTPTRPNGCFTWMETIPFSFFVKRSRWVVVERDIVGVGIHSGRRRIRLALNPWALGKDSRDSGEAVLYLRDEAFPASKLAENAAFDDDSMGSDQLFVDEVSIQTIRRGERNSGTLLTMNISMEPKVRFENAEGIPQYKKLESGDFQIRAHLVLNETGDKLTDRMILTSDVNTDNKGEEVEIAGVGKVIDGKLIARLNAYVDPRLRQGNLELVLKVIPTVRGLKSFGGIYELGALRNLSSTASGALNNECRNVEGCDTGQYLRDASNYEAVKAKSLASSGHPYLFDRLKLRFVQVQPGETATRRSVAYNASTCVIDAFTGDRVVGLKFRIKYKDPAIKEIEKGTAEDGCLNWDATIFHKYYDPEEFIPQSVTITKDTGVSRELKFYINPWDDKFTFGFDEREFTQQFWDRLRNRNKIESRFFLADFGYHTVRFQYNIDSLMNLEVRKTVLMELQPQVLRYSGIINARKMTEALRDGIWLMKVGIQKNYLDPAQAGVVIDTLQNVQAQVRMNYEPGGEAKKEGHTRLRKLGIEANPKEYISTETALVRVTDGVIIQPVELRMQDLRMMRIRTNFLVQLEAVDERKLQMENSLHDGLREELDDLLEKRRVLSELARENGKLEDQERLKKEEEQIRERFESRRQVSRRVFDYINRQLNAVGEFVANFDELKLDADQKEYIRKIMGYNPKNEQESEDKKSLKNRLDKNDFTKIKLPACNEIDCNKFIEVKSGLERRTFVGPVIFLSNAYKDSVRATDNLDEAKCNQRVNFDDPFHAEFATKEREMFLDSDSANDKARTNGFYKFSEYFGSLRHLCGAQVDDLIDREREDRELYEKSGAAVASVHHFASTYKLDFVSLANEKLKTVEFTPENVKRCNRDLVSCMTNTTDRWMSAESALELVNRHIGDTNVNGSGITRWWNGDSGPIKTEPWNLEDLRSALFDPALFDIKFDNGKKAVDGKILKAERFAACSMSMNQLVYAAKNKGKFPKETHWNKILGTLITQCVSNPEMLTVDHKLRVYKTGQDGDSYIFLGGLQLNLNVGQSFGVSRSDSWSWGAGFEAFDVVAMGGRSMALLAKPLNLKVGKGHSMSSGEGTSVSDSTYLVAQIARFKVRLDIYEECSVLKPNVKYLAENGFPHLVMSGKNGLYADSMGMLVCEGNRRTTPRYVKEDYFYFTQHFTEGDMLDQADLYNHPWLLALRGQRDFGTFLHMIRSQEVVSFGNFTKGALGLQIRNIGWPLEQMLGVYKEITPSFPGFYTVLDQNEEMTQFPLERRMSKGDQDINYEMVSRERRVPRNSNPR